LKDRLDSTPLLRFQANGRQLAQSHGQKRRLSR
jgi:hypothetical protein